MTSQQPSEGPHGVQGFKCDLPVPFANGVPADYSRMSLMELRKFIAFFYKSLTENDLPSSKGSRNVKPPTWWPNNVSHDKFLSPRGINAPVNQKGAEELHRLRLVALVLTCYQNQGLTSLLAVGKEMASKRIPYHYQKTSDDSQWRLVDFNGRTLIVVDEDSRTYDSTDRILRERPSTDKKNSGPEIIEIDITGENSEDSRSNVSVRSNGTRGSSTDGRQKQVSQVKPVNKPKPVAPKIGGKKRGKGKAKKGSKRKLFEIEDDLIDDNPVSCKYCAKEFRYAEFCTEEHEKQCPKGPKVEVTKDDFMTGFGMVPRPQFKAPLPPNLPSTSKNVAPAAPVMAAPLGRPVRKVPKRTKAVAAIRSNQIPLTSVRGQKLIKELDCIADKTFPPDYERDCRPRYGYRREPEKDYQNVMKKTIAKDSENPHMFTLGRRQRQARFQELVVGLNKESWAALNKVKPVSLILKKLKPIGHTLCLPPNMTKLSHFERMLAGAIQLPRIRLIDIEKRQTPEFLKYVTNNKKNETSVVNLNESFSSCNSTDSADSLFVSVAGVPSNPKKMKK